MTLAEYISKIEHLFTNVDSVIEEILKDNEKYTVLKIRQRMRQVGPLPSVGQYKNEGEKRRGGTSLRKKGNIKLYDTGAFNESLFVEMIGRKLQMDSNHEQRRAVLVPKYGENIFNLKNEEVNFILINFIIPELREIVEPGEALTIDIG